MSGRPDPERKRYSLLFWLFFSVVVSLASVWVVVLVGVAVGKPAYEAPLHDGTFYAYTVVLVALSFGAFFQDLLAVIRAGIKVPEALGWGLFAIAGLIVLGGGAVVMYAIKALNAVEKVTVRRDIEPVLGIGAAIGAIAYGLGCEYLRSLLAAKGRGER